MIWEVKYQINDIIYKDKLKLNTLDKKVVKKWFLDNKHINVLTISGDYHSYNEKIKFIDCKLIL